MAKKRASRKVGARRGRPPGRRPAAASATTSGPASVAVSYLQAAQQELLGQRSSLDAQIEQIEKMLRTFGAAPAAAAAVGRPRRGRPPGRSSAAAPVATGTAASAGYRPGSLKAYIADVLSAGGVKSVKEISEGVLATGYPTRNRTLAKSVGIALTEMKNVKKVGRGKFRLK